MPNDYSNDFDRPYGERNSGSGRDYTYSSARDYRAAGELNDRDERGDRNHRDDRNFRSGGTGYGGGYRPDNQGGRENYGTGNRDYYGSNRSGRYGSESYGSDRSDSDNYGSSSYGSGQYGSDRYGSGNYSDRNDNDYGDRSYGERNYGSQNYGNRSYGSNRNDRGHGQQQYRGDTEYRGAYASDGHRFTEGQNDRDRNERDRNARDRWSTDQFRGGGSQNRDYGRAPQGYDYQDRGFIERAGDEVRSWFGDEEAERRRELDQRYDDRENQGRDRNQGQSRGRSSMSSSFGHDDDYSSWRKNQVDALDRDYDEYRRENARKFDEHRQENARKFESEFGTWRSNRQTQRASLSQVKEHAEVVGSDGAHVGTVDKVRDDRIILTKTDKDAGGRHHSIPSSWLKSVDDKVTISKTADEAKNHWRDEEENSAMFGNEQHDAKTSTYGSSTSTSFGNSTSGSSTSTTGTSGLTDTTGLTGSSSTTGSITTR